MDKSYEDFKLIVFKAGSKGRLGIVTVDTLVNQANLIKRMAKLGIKIIRRMHKIEELLNIGSDKKGGEEEKELAA